MKPICQLVFEYIDGLEVGDIVTMNKTMSYNAFMK